MDSLFGDAGRDAFVFGFQSWRPSSSGIGTGVGCGERDIVLDFRQGEDVLDFAGYRAGYSSTLPTVFLGTGEFVHEQRTQVRYEVQDGRTIVEFYAGDLYEAGEMPALHGQIELFGNYELAASDFKSDYDMV